MRHMELAEMYKYFLARYITRYNGQWYCYLCKLNLRNVEYHLQKVHPDINIETSTFPDKYIELSDTECRELLNHGIAIKNILQFCNIKYFCELCKCPISTLNHIDAHLKEEKHQTCISKLKSELLNHGQVIKEVSQNDNGKYFCVPCNCSLFKLEHVNEHLKGKRHQKSISNTKSSLLSHEQVIKEVLQNCNIQYSCIPCNRSIPTLEHVNEHLKGKRHQKSISNTKSILLNHEQVIKEVLQNCNIQYSCIPCNCSIPTLEHVNAHLKGKRHQTCISNIKSKDFPNDQQKSTENINDVSINIKTQTEFISKSKFVAKTQPVCKNKLAEDNLNNIEAEEEKNEESISSLESYKKDSNSNNVLQVERCVNMCFCSLCDKFDNIKTINKHIQNKSHLSAISALQIFNQQAIYIIKLENRKTIKPLQLNSRKLDGTMWPECMTMSKYICDQCNITIKENDIINHEVTVHEKSMVSSMKYIHDLSLSLNGKNVNLNNFSYYPMFKCSFCNEIIHGISMLRSHFSKCQHEENIKSLIKVKRQEYNHSGNIESFFELLQFLNLISFENNGDTVQIMEQPVMYIKNHRASFHKSSDDLIQNKFTYICIACKRKFHAIQDVINHLSTKKRHLKHFKDILLTYNIYSICTTKKLDKQAAEFPVCIENASMDTLEEHNINKTQAAQYINTDLIIKANTDSKDDILSQDGESNSGLFMPRDIFLDMTKLIKNPFPAERNKFVPIKKDNILDCYNKMYCKKYLDFEDIMFAYNQNKLKEIKLNLQLYAFKDKNMLCLACNVIHSHNIHTLYEHIRCEQHIMQLTQLHKSSEEHRLRLLKELIKVEHTNFKCYACNKNEKWAHHKLGEFWIKEHMCYPAHKKNRQKLLKDIENILQEFNSLWYNIQYFACVECDARFKRKMEFMEHLDKKHSAFLSKKDNSKFDFCLTCATLWYQNQDLIYQQHCRKITHQYLAKSKDFAVTSISQSLQELFKDVNQTIDCLVNLSDDTFNDLTNRTTTLVNDLKHTFETQQFRVEVCMFGSRITGLALPNSDIDVYLNFSECTEIKNKSKLIQNCLHTDSENWEIELTLNRSRIPIIKVKHRRTGLQCDISFTNSLSVENSKLIRSFNTAYPSCRKLILFLKKWISLGNLAGPDKIRSYALTWLVIFYLQVEHKIPNVAALIKIHNNSKIVSGWETGVGNIVVLNNVPDLSIYKLLLGFFEYYGRFDYMHDVICPLLGVTCRKESFTEVLSLPDTMALYIAQLQKEKPEYFRIDSPMCVQDPFDLSHNLTKAVPILTLKRFKQYCNESALILRNLCTSSSKKNV